MALMAVRYELPLFIFSESTGASVATGSLIYFSPREDPTSLFFFSLAVTSDPPLLSLPGEELSVFVIPFLSSSSALSLP